MKIFALLFLLAYSAFGACSKISMPTDFSSVASGTRANLKANFSETENKFNPCADSVDEVRGRFSGYSANLLMSSLENLRLRLDSDASATSKLIVEGSNGDTLFRVSEDSAARFFGALTGTSLSLSGTATTTGIHTFTAAPILSSLTASLPVFTNGSKALASNVMTGTGSVVMSASPTLTGTMAAANGTYSGTLAVSGNATIGDATVTDRIVNIIAPAGQYRVLQFSTASSPRWAFRVANGSESGSSANADFELYAYNDAGVAIDAPMLITRAAGGAMTLSRPVSFSVAPTFSSVTASQFLLVDGSKALTSVAGSGTGSVMRAASPTTTGTLTADAANFSGAVTVGGNHTVSRSNSGDIVSSGVANTSNTASSDTYHYVTVAGTSAGDAAYQVGFAGTGTFWTWGLDNSDGDAWVLSEAGFLGSSNRLKVAAGGAVSIPGTTTATGGLTLGARFIDHTTSITSATTLSTVHSTVFASAASGAYTITLPAVSGNAGLTYTIFKNDLSSNTITIDGNASETIGEALTVVLAGNNNNSRLVIVCTGSAWMVKELYDEGSFTTTLTGGTTSPTSSSYFVRIGKSVTLSLGGTANVTSNSTSFTYTGLPAAIQPPAITQVMPLSSAIDNGALVHAVSARITAASGTITFSLNGSTTGWTNSGNKGLGASDSRTFTYTLN